MITFDLSFLIGARAGMHIEIFIQSLNPLNPEAAPF